MRIVLNLHLVLRLGGAFVALGLMATACSTAETESEDLTIIATTSILGDIAAEVVGDAADIEVLTPLGVDPHDYRPSSRQIAALNTADLVIATGLGLEEGLIDVLEAAEEDGVRVLWIGPQVDPLPFAGHDEQHPEEATTAPHTEDRSGLDPHFWLDPVRAGRAADLIGTALETTRPGPGWTERAAAYADELATLDAEIRRVLAGIAEPRRLLVTNHDALGYFADTYGFEVVGVVIPGGSTLADPSSADLAALAATIEASGVTAIFAETIESDALAEAVAAEVDRPIEIVELFTGSLGPPGSGAETLGDMLLTNATRIARALS